jgi:polar amino acid transport system substrate-binding protein
MRTKFSFFFLVFFWAVACGFGVAKAQEPLGLPILRWADDTQSGIPYAFYDPKNIKNLIGFEVEIIESVAKLMGREPRFQQNDRTALIPGLQRGSYDVALSGLNYSNKADGVVFSKPYLVTYLQLVVHEKTDHIRSLGDCQGQVVGTLASSAAQGILARLSGVKIRPYASELSAFEDLAFGRLDAILLDATTCIYYAATQPGLRLVGDPISRIEYCIAVSGQDPLLVYEINDALDQMIASGQLRQILERWKLWNPYMADLLKDYEPSITEPTAYEAFIETQRKPLSFRERFNLYLDFMPLLAEASWMTIKISILAMILAIALGLVVALFRVYGPRPLSICAIMFVELIRGVPLLIQLYIIYYGLPRLGIWMDPLTAGIIGLGINYSAYEAENYRAGLVAVPVDQVEAASALAMSRWQSLRYVVFPQAIRMVIPPVTNDFISLMKDSSLVSMITIVELAQRYNLLASTYYDYFGIGLVVATIYLVLGMPFIRIARMAEIYFKR